MSHEKFYATKMLLKTDDELKNYIENQDHFQEDAVLAALLELEKRGVAIEGSEKIKQTITNLKTVEKVEEVDDDDSTTAESVLKETPELYSTKFIYIFGAFTLLGGSILMAINFVTLKNKRAARIAVVGTIIYSILLSFVFEAIGLTLTNESLAIDTLIILFFTTIATNILGIYLLNEYIWKKEAPNEITYNEKNIWKPILIVISISMLFFMMLGNIAQ